MPEGGKLAAPQPLLPVDEPVVLAASALVASDELPPADVAVLVAAVAVASPAEVALIVPVELVAALVAALVVRLPVPASAAELSAAPLGAESELEQAADSTSQANPARPVAATRTRW